MYFCPLLIIQVLYSFLKYLFMFSLMDVLHHDRKLYLVFEYVDYDLKKYMDKHAPNGIPVQKVKVWKFEGSIIENHIYMYCNAYACNLKYITLWVLILI